MPKEFAEKWVKALRSGEYKQVQRHLSKDDCFCCLGVLGTVCLGIPIKQLVFFHESIIGIAFLKDIKEPIPIGLTSELQEELINLNDKDLYTFPQIADWIEANVEFTEQPTTV